MKRVRKGRGEEVREDEGIVEGELGVECGGRRGKRRGGGGRIRRRWGMKREKNKIENARENKGKRRGEGRRRETE